jgi:hypothetical protein
VGGDGGGAAPAAVEERVIEGVVEANEAVGSGEPAAAMDATPGQAFEAEALPGEGPAVESAKRDGEVMFQGLALEVAPRLGGSAFALRLRDQGAQLSHQLLEATADLGRAAGAGGVVMEVHRDLPIVVLSPWPRAAFPASGGRQKEVSAVTCWQGTAKTRRAPVPRQHSLLSRDSCCAVCW